MANIFEFKGFVPVVHESAYVHPNATVTGNVFIGKNVYIGPGAAIRGDWGGIEIVARQIVGRQCGVSGVGPQNGRIQDTWLYLGANS